jgi:hypothetical protein
MCRCWGGVLGCYGVYIYQYIYIYILYTNILYKAEDVQVLGWSACLQGRSSTGDGRGH